MKPARRIDLLGAVGLATLLGLGGRLFAISIVRHRDLRTAAERRSRRATVLPPRRGAILDRNRLPLARDLPVQQVVVDLPELDPTLSLVPRLAWCLRIERLEALARLRQARALVEGRDPDETEVLLGVVPIEEGERIKRLLRRSRHLRGEPAPAGIRLVVSAGVLQKRYGVLTRLADLLGLERAAIDAQVTDRVSEIYALDDREERLIAWREPLVVLRRADFAQVARVTERAFELRGVEVRERFERHYPQADTAVHLIGTLGAPSASEAVRDVRDGRVIDSGATLRDYVLQRRREVPADMRLRDERYGRTGLERSQQDRIRGVPGIRVEVRDVKGGVRDTLLDVAPRDGETLELTLDVEIQRGAERALDEAVRRWGDAQAGGAAVLIDLADGGVLALASSPRYDPNTLGEDYPQIVKDPRKPLLHRAVLAQAPGSTFKILSAFAIHDPAEPDALPVGWTTTCTGRLTRREARSGGRCDGHHGETGLAKAIEQSCNIYFYRAAHHIGLHPLSDWAAALGIDRPIGLDIGGERRGQIPYVGYKADRLDDQVASVALWSRRLAEAARRDPPDALALRQAYDRLEHAETWRKRHARDQTLRPGEVRNTIIGQGDVQLNPLQVATIAALVASEGQVPLPRLIRDTTPVVRSLPLDPRTLAAVQRGMRRVVTHGTARKEEMGLRHLDVAGKTGTAERQGKEPDGSPKPNLAWFMGYYPASAPEVAFAVLVDRTRGHGGAVCAPVTRALLEAYEQARGGRLR